MRIPRLTLVGLLATSAAALLVFAAMAAGAASTRRFSNTHRMTVTGQLVDHWTINDSGRCGLVGGGTITVDYHMTKVALVRPYIDPSAGVAGSWILGIPYGGGVLAMGGRPAIGTITRVDNTVQTPPPTGDCGDPPDKSGCGTVALRRPQSYVHGYDRRRLLAELSVEEFNYSRGVEVACHIGSLTGFSDPGLAGGNRRGELLLTMPQARALRRGTVTVTGSSHKFTSGTEGGVSRSDNVTRRVTVTFTHL